MKNTLIISILLLIASLTSYAQEIVPLEDQYDYEHQGTPYYLKDVNNLLDKFTGEWEFTDATHYLKIKFYKVEGINETSYPKETYDQIRSFMLYKEKQGTNWVIVYNTYPTTYTIADLNNQNFNNDYGIKGNIFYKNDNLLELNYYEPAPPCTIQPTIWVGLTYTNTANNPQLQWQLDTKSYSWTTTEPCNMTINNPKQYPKIPHQLILNKL